MITKFGNIYHTEVIEGMLVETIKTFQTIYKVRVNGKIETLTSSSGWYII